MSACLGVAIGPMPKRSMSYAEVIAGGNSMAQQPVQYINIHSELRRKKSPISHHLRSTSALESLVAGLNFVLFILDHPPKIDCDHSLKDGHDQRPLVIKFDNLVDFETTVDIRYQIGKSINQEIFQ